MGHPGPPTVTKVSFRRYAPGEGAQPGEYDCGDFILTHSNALVSRLIRWAQGLRFRGPLRRYTWWSHAALIVSKEGELIEAVGRGIERAPLSKYQPTEYHLVRVGNWADERDRNQAVSFARWCLKHREKYGYLTVLSIFLSLLTGSKLTFGFEGQAICSGLVARALERTSIIFDRSPSHIMPADLAQCFKVEPPPPGTSKGQIPSK